MERKYFEYRSRRPSTSGRPSDRRRTVSESRARQVLRANPRPSVYDQDGTATAFVCANCGSTVAIAALGTGQRNHCPRCLHSVHVDIAVGDRRSLCRGIMDPVSLWVREDGEVSLIHRCRRCGVMKANRVAGDDDEEAVRRIAARTAGAVARRPS